MVPEGSSVPYKDGKSREAVVVVVVVVGGGGGVPKLNSSLCWGYGYSSSGTTRQKKINDSLSYCRINGSSALTLTVSLYTLTRVYTLLGAALNLSKNK